jgi:hypothetical protein
MDDSAKRPHQMLVVRTKVLNDDWEVKLKKHYPLFRSQADATISMAA